MVSILLFEDAKSLFSLLSKYEIALIIFFSMFIDFLFEIWLSFKVFRTSNSWVFFSLKFLCGCNIFDFKFGEFFELLEQVRGVDVAKPLSIDTFSSNFSVFSSGSDSFPKNENIFTKRFLKNIWNRSIIK